MSPSDTQSAATQLEALLAAMGFDATIKVTGDTPLQLEIASPEAGALIGHRGEGLRSIQHLLRLLHSKDNPDTSVIVDIEGYRQKQHDQLVEQAKRRAEEVIQTGRLSVMAPMSSYERRLVHMALADQDEVVTESLGDGQNRRVMIKKA